MVEDFHCCLCNSNCGEVAHNFDCHVVIACGNCAHLSTHPPPRKVDLSTHYSERYYGDDGKRMRSKWLQKVQAAFRWRRAWRLRKILYSVRGRRVLDLGCGNGLLLYWLQRWGAEASGMEISNSAALSAAKLLGKDCIKAESIERADYPDHSFDLITAWHVLEHLDDPLYVLEKIARIIKPDGLVYVEVPNAGSWSARRLSSSWLGYDVPNHLHHFTPEMLQELAARAGLYCVRETYWSLEYSPVTLLQSLVNTFVGGDSFLFRSLSYDKPLPVGSRIGLLLKFVLHVGLACVLVLPAFLMSVVLAWLRKGDTYGAYLRSR